MRCSAYKLKDMMKCERFLLIISRIMLYTFAVALVCACGVWLFGKFPIMILVLVGHYIIIEWCVLPLLVIWTIVAMYVIFRNILAGKNIKKVKRNLILITRILCLALLSLFYHESLAPSVSGIYGLTGISMFGITSSVALACFVIALSDNMYVNELDDKR